MLDQICLSEEQQDELVHALVAERMHLLLVGGSQADQTVLLNSLELRLRPAISLVRDGSELEALLHVKQWLSRLKPQAPEPETDGWCAPGPQDEPRFAIVLNTAAPEGIDRGRRSLGHSTQFLFTLPHELDQQRHAALLHILDHRVVEIQLNPQLTPRSTSQSTQAYPHRLEAILVGLILVLVGLSTLWLADSAISESVLQSGPTSVWSVRP